VVDSIGIDIMDGDSMSHVSEQISGNDDRSNVFKNAWHDFIIHIFMLINMQKFPGKG
jgi:hypothetical protein